MAKTIKQLENEKKQIENELQKARATQHPLLKLTDAEYKNLRDIYNQVYNGITEKRIIKIEYEVEIQHCLDEGSSLIEGKAFTKSSFKVLPSTNDKHLANAAIEWFNEWTYSPVDESKDTKKKYKELVKNMHKQFAKISKEKGIEVKDIFNNISSYASLKEFKRDLEG